MPLQPVLMHSRPSYTLCHSHQRALLSITLQDRQLPACLPPAPGYTTGWVAGVAVGQAAC